MKRILLSILIIGFLAVGAFAFAPSKAKAITLNDLNNLVNQVKSLTEEISSLKSLLGAQVVSYSSGIVTVDPLSASLVERTLDAGAGEINDDTTITTVSGLTIDALTADIKSIITLQTLTAVVDPIVTANLDAVVDYLPELSSVFGARQYSVILYSHDGSKNQVTWSASKYPPVMVFDLLERRLVANYRYNIETANGWKLWSPVTAVSVSNALVAVTTDVTLAGIASTGVVAEEAPIAIVDPEIAMDDLAGLDLSAHVSPAGWAYVVLYDEGGMKLTSFRQIGWNVPADELIGAAKYDAAVWTGYAWDWFARKQSITAVVSTVVGVVAAPTQIVALPVVLPATIKKKLTSALVLLPRIKAALYNQQSVGSSGSKIIQIGINVPQLPTNPQFSVEDSVLSIGVISPLEVPGFSTGVGLKGEFDVRVKNFSTGSIYIPKSWAGGSYKSNNCSNPLGWSTFWCQRGFEIMRIVPDSNQPNLIDIGGSYMIPSFKTVDIKIYTWSNTDKMFAGTYTAGLDHFYFGVNSSNLWSNYITIPNNNSNVVAIAGEPGPYIGPLEVGSYNIYPYNKQITAIAANILPYGNTVEIVKFGNPMITYTYYGVPSNQLPGFPSTTRAIVLPINLDINGNYVMRILSGSLWSNGRYFQYPNNWY